MPVKLVTAWTWDCPTCGKRNHTNGVVVQDLAETESCALGLCEGELAVSAPEEVVCEACLSVERVDFAG
jgi:hypothetical protein